MIKVTVSEAAVEADVSERTVRRWIADGLLVPLNVARRPHLFDLDQVLEVERDTRTRPRSASY